MSTPATSARRSPSRQPSVFRVHVSPAGNDRWSGIPSDPDPARTDGPVATLHAARDRVRAWRRAAAANRKRPARIVLRGGWHHLDAPLELGPEDSGTAAAPLVIAAARGERPIVSGGEVITGWRETTLNGQKVWEARLDSSRWKDMEINQIFVNNVRCFPSRLPAEGFFRFRPNPSGGDNTYWGKTPGTTALYTPGQIDPAWHNLTDVRLIAVKGWLAPHVRIKKVDAKEQRVTLHGAGLVGGVCDADGQASRFWAENVREGLTQGGFFYHDRKVSKLYYMPRFGDLLENAVVVVPRLRYLVRFQGHPLKKRIRHVRFENLDFRHAAYAHPADYPGPVQADFTVPGAITFYGAEQCGLFGCRISQCAQYAVEFRIGCTNNKVVGCHLHDLGGGGVKILNELGVEAHKHVSPEKILDLQELGWQLPKGSNLADYRKLPRQKVTVSDCLIEDAGKMFLASVGIWIGEASGNTVRHNEIRTLNYSGISCGWCWGYNYDVRCGDNVMEYNHIHHLNVNRWLNDLGGIYTLGPQPGTLLRGNHIHDVFRSVYGNWGIYHDNGSSFIHDEFNALHHCTYAAYNINDARDIRARHNLIVMDNDPDNPALSWGRDPGTRALLAQHNVIVSQPPQVLGSGSFCGHITFTDNLIWDPLGRILLGRRLPEGLSLKQWLEDGYGRGDRAADPLLYVTRDGLPMLSKDSPALKMGFKPADLSRCGPRFHTQAPCDWSRWADRKEPPRPCVLAVLLCEGAIKGTSVHGHVGMFNDWIVHPSGKAIAFTLRVANRGETPVNGTLRVGTNQPAMATFKGRTECAYRLRPGQEKTFAFSVTLAPGARRVLIEAAPVGKDFPVPTALFLYADKAPPMLGERRLAMGQWE